MELNKDRSLPELFRKGSCKKLINWGLNNLRSVKIDSLLICATYTLVKEIDL